jgi:hypothetical protein
LEFAITTAATANAGAGPAEAAATDSAARATAIGLRSGGDAGGGGVGLNAVAMKELTAVTPSRMKPIATKLMKIARVTWKANLATATAPSSRRFCQKTKRPSQP